MPRPNIAAEPDVEARIDLSPMIDCIFILLIFFIVTTVFIEEPGVDVFKPDASVDADLEKNSIIIAVTADNKVVYGGRELGVAGVGARVRQLLNKDELPVIIQADANADHGVFSDVWSEVKNAGAKKISLSTRND
ncbi:MAG: biopolymer transporter ExbD [Spirochaetaceae bacterium]|nr:biopolymer transporter ExbD [Planctomycetota bacterium]MCA9505440.1 biopolymer transporter ExbD [Myxococcales bacterium]MCB9725967.1 biopolymer transporter ExbD [Spirochaetaceae bacterium]HPG24310.1 biopolymer transporter ExbD [Myxococcota bacterium]